MAQNPLLDTARSFRDDLRGCMHDQVVFLQGGTRVVPISEIRMPVTVAQADSLVEKLKSN